MVKSKLYFTSVNFTAVYTIYSIPTLLPYSRRFGCYTLILLQVTYIEISNLTLYLVHGDSKAEIL